MLPAQRYWRASTVVDVRRFFCSKKPPQGVAGEKVYQSFKQVEVSGPATFLALAEVGYTRKGIQRGNIRCC